MTEVERLKQRLEKMSAKRFNIFWGDQAHLLTPEERAGHVHKLLDAMEAGEFTTVTDAEMDAWDASPELDAVENF